MAFTLNTQQTLAILNSVPDSTRCFGEFSVERDGEHYLGFRDDVTAIFSHETQTDIAPRWKTKHAVYDLWAISAEFADDAFVVGGDVFCLKLRFEITCDDDHDKLPVSWNIPQTTALRPGVICRLPARKSQYAVITFAEKLIRDSGDDSTTYAIETGYVAGAKWAEIAELEQLSHLQSLCGTLACSADLSIARYFIGSELEGCSPSIHVACDILHGYGSEVDHHQAANFWNSLGKIDLPTPQWVLGFCAGAIRISAAKSC